MNYSAYHFEDLVRIAKRDNNSKRPFLLVNPLQGKHIPASPSECFRLFSALADKVFAQKKEEPVLIVGFAETATAIGAALSSLAPFDTFYINTTREYYPGREWLYFSEEHSHATEQKLDKSFLDAHLKKGMRILFAEDEVTTGKTIENIIAVMEKTYPALSLRFGIASLLNGMEEEKIESLKERDIPCYYLVRVPSCQYDSFLSGFSYPENLRIDDPSGADFPKAAVQEAALGGCLDPRLGVFMKDYDSHCLALTKELTERFALSDNSNSKKEEDRKTLSSKKILILGTEECMYPGLYWGRYLQEHAGHRVFFHATTRSPILPSPEEDYPLHCRIRLESFYDKERTTYLYNPDSYDAVFVLTDSPVHTGAGSVLASVFSSFGVPSFTEIFWTK